MKKATHLIGTGHMTEQPLHYADAWLAARISLTLDMVLHSSFQQCLRKGQDNLGI